MLSVTLVICLECEAGLHEICCGRAIDPKTHEVVGCQCDADC